MEIIRGKQASYIESSTLAERLAGYDRVHIDIGTGDGRFVLHAAHTYPRTFVIGIDACRENLHTVSRRAPDNTLFVIANAQALPPEVYGLAAHITVNFPWGSLLAGLLTEDAGLLAGLAAVAQPKATLHVHLNGGAMAEAGWALEAGAERVYTVLAARGFAMRTPKPMLATELKTLPTTWAKRIAFGRDPRAMLLRGTRQEVVSETTVYEAGHLTGG